MTLHLKRFFGIFFLLCILNGNTLSQNNVNKNVSQLSPLQSSEGFVENKGQISDVNGRSVEEVLFKLETSDLDLYITDTGLTYVLKKLVRNEDEKKQFKWERIDLLLDGAVIHRENIFGRTVFENTNFFYENCPNGIYNVHTYDSLIVKNVYPQIDWVFYNPQNGGFKYDFILNEGANLSDIQLIYQGSQEIEILENGALLIANGFERILTESPPVTFYNGSLVNSKFRKVSTTKNKNEGYDNLIVFEIDKASERKIAKIEKGNNQLVIDPKIEWCTLYGAGAFESGMAMDTDNNGDVVIVGYTGSTSFPKLDTGTFYQGVLDAGQDIFILKFNNDGIRYWATYYGGSSASEFPYSVVTDSNNNIFVCGITGSSVFPVYDAGTYFSETKGGGTYDSFILKFSEAGERLWATYYGGGNDDYAQAILVDSEDDVLVVGYTNSEDFSVLDGEGYFQEEKEFSFDAYILKFDNDGERLGATHYGGGTGGEGISVGADKAYAAAIDGLDNLFIVGTTTSPEFPLQDAGTFFQGSRNGGQDAFIVKFDASGERLWSTYYGGAVSEWLYSTATDFENNLIICGVTNSSDFPLLDTGGFFQAEKGDDTDAIIMKFDNDGNRIWSTYYGGNGEEKFTTYANLSVDSKNNVYCSFDTKSSDMFTTPFCDGGYLKPTKGGSKDQFITKFNADCSLNGATYLGSLAADFRSPNTVDLYDNFWMSGEFLYTPFSFSYPFVDIGGDGYYDDSFSGDDDVFILKLVASTPIVSESSSPDTCSLCNGSAQVVFSEGIICSRSYYWSNGAETLNSLDSSNVITGLCSGYYSVEIVSACDTIYIDSIFVDSYATELYSEFGTDTIICGSDSYILDAGIVGASYEWQDGSDEQFFEVTESGTYSVVINTGGVCTEVKSQNILMNEIPVNLGVDSSICEADTIALNAGYPGSIYLWSDDHMEQIHSIEGAGTYWVNVDSSGCIGTDTIVIYTHPRPVIDLGGDTLICSNDNLLLDAGNPLANYLWQDGSEDQFYIVEGTGTYSVIVDSVGCTNVDSINVEFIPLHEVNIGADTAICGNELIILDAENPDANFEWQDGSTEQIFMVSESGLYWVNVDSSECVNSDSIFVTLTEDLVVDLGSDTSICVGSAIVLDAGNDGSIFEWQDGSSDQTIEIFAEGEYWVMVDSSGCIYSDTITVLTIPVPSVDLGTDTSICSNNTLVLDAGLADNYEWQDGSDEQFFNVTESGTYWVNSILSICYGTDTIDIIVHPAPEIVFAEVVEELVCLDHGVVSMTATPLGGSFSGAGVVGSNFDPSITGEGMHMIHYSYTDDEGCMNTDSIQITVVDCLGVPNQNQISITIFPNPFSNFTTINFGQELTENHTIVIHNTLGQEVYRNEKVVGTSLEIKKKELGIGVYILSLYNANSKELFSTKLLVE